MNFILNFENEEWVKCPTEDYTPQSVEQVETVGFMDKVTGEESGWTVPSDALDLADATDNASLQAFLSRPVRIDTRDWVMTDLQGVLVTISPWNLYLGNVRVAKKLANFAYLRANLKMKFVLNGSPFYYGAVRAVYQPLPNFTPSTIKGSTAASVLIPYSQRPGVMLRPGQNAGGELTAPFVYPKTWFNLAADDSTGVGSLSYVIYAPLRSANGVGSTAVTISCYAWLEDVELSSATLYPQSNEVDEYGDGPISKPATAIANVAASFKATPFVGKFATATEIGARSVASIAKLFGYTNVPVIDNLAPYVPHALPPMASTEIGFPIQKLTVDSKNELAVAPSATGLDNEDELSISSLVTRDSYVANFTWGTTDSADTRLFISRVTPRMFYLTSEANNGIVDQTPMSFVSSMFQYWRGDIIFKFDIIRSKYHRGRLRISFDPTGSASVNLFNVSEASNAVFTTIVDIDETDSVEFTVPYQQALAYLECRQNLFYQTSHIPWTDTSYQSSQVGRFCNGYISVRVLNELSAPVAVAPVTILVSVRGADNLEFANPRDISPYTSYFQAQSEEVSDTTSVQIALKEGEWHPERTRVYMGERISSLRPLLRRMNYIGPITLTETAMTGGTTIVKYIFHKMPPTWGFDLNGEQAATGLVVATGKAFNYANVNPITYLAPAYVYYRGSMNWTFNYDNPNGSSANIGVSRYVNPSSNSILINTIPGTSASSAGYMVARYLPTGTAGTAVTNQHTQSGVSIALPNYTNYKFQSTNPVNGTKPPSSGVAYDGSDTDAGIFYTTDTEVPINTKVHRFAGIGVDFNLHFFLNVPSMYYYGTFPVAV